MVVVRNYAPIGVKMARDNFRALTRDIERKAFAVTVEMAEEVAEIARGLAPKGNPLNWRESRNWEIYPVLEESIEVVAEKGRISVEARAGHAGYVEFGTVHQDSQPFMRPAINAARTRVNRRLGRIQKGLGAQIGTDVTRRRRRNR